MPFPTAMTRVNRAVVNPVLGRLSGRVAPLALLEHRGRRTGRTLHTPVFAFERDGVVTVALTYGSGVQWLANAVAAGGATVHHRGRTIRLGPPRVTGAEEGMPRVPAAIRVVLRAASVGEFALFPVLS